MSEGFHELTVLGTREEIGGAAKTVMFDVPQALSDRFQWQAGQHLSLRFTIDGKEVRRSYSISNSPHMPQPLQVTAKRVSGVLASNHIHDTVCQGDSGDVITQLWEEQVNTNREGPRSPEAREGGRRKTHEREREKGGKRGEEGEGEERREGEGKRERKKKRKKKKK